MLKYTRRKHGYPLLYGILLRLSRLLRPVYHLLVSCHLHNLKALWLKVNGYHFGVLCCAWSSMVVLVLNVSATIWAGSNFSIKDGIGTLYAGSCKQNSNLGFWIHLLINVLSTILLGASNYTMQCLNSPSRAAIDKAHSKGSWLDVGLPSYSNIWQISGYRKALWWALAVSTIPLHLLWNSAVFVSLSTHNYVAWVVPDDYGQIMESNITDQLLRSRYFPQPVTYPWITRNSSGSLYNATLGNATFNQQLANFSDSRDDKLWDEDIVYEFLYTSNQFRANSSTFEKLNKGKCLKKYAGPIIPDRADVLLISSNKSTDSSPPGLLFDNYPVDFISYSSMSTYGAGAWICNNHTLKSESTGDCDIHDAVLKVKSSVFEKYNIESCLSQTATELCSLQFSVVIMIIVIICNFVKLVCMSYVVWRKDAAPLITLGDAISSFLTREDMTTIDLCLADKAYFQAKRRRRKSSTTVSSRLSPRIDTTKGKRLEFSWCQPDCQVCYSRFALS